MPTQIPHATHFNNRSVAAGRTRTLTVGVVDPQCEEYSAWRTQAQPGALRVEIVATSAEALRLAQTGTIDLWVINTELPGLSGYELCAMLKSQSPQTPVYLVANDYSAETERAAWRARATCFGCKPAHETWLTQWLASRWS